MTTKSSMGGEKRACRWYQFGLRSLFVVVSLFAAGLALWTRYVGPYGAQRHVMDTIDELGGGHQSEAADKWLRRIYGDGFRNVVLVDVADCPDPDAYLAHVAALPRLQTLVVGGPNFADEELRQLQGMEALRWLVLDCTNVTNEAIEELKQDLSNLVVHRSRRLQIDALRRLTPRGGVGCRRTYQHPQLCLLVGEKHFQDVLAVELTVDNFGGNVGDADLVQLRPFARLNELHLCDQTRVTDAGLAHLKGFTRLQYLRLDGTQVTDAGLAHLQGLSELRKLWLNRTRVTDDGVRQLQRALPTCQIRR